MKNKRSSPKSKPKHTKDAVIGAIKRRKGKLYLAATDLQVTAQTIRNYSKRWPEVRDAIREAKGLMLDAAESKLYKAIDKGEGWAICFYLKCQGKHRGYVERTEQRIGGDKNAPPIKTGNGQEVLTDEQRLQRLRQLADRIRRRRNGVLESNGACRA